MVLLRWLVLFVAVFVAAHLPFLGITYDTMGDLLIAALVLCIVNSFLKPILVLFSLPLILVSLGFFLLVINALLLELVSWLIAGFHVPSFWSAVGGSIVISIVSFFLGADVTRLKGRRNGTRQGPPGRGPVIDI